METNLRVRVRDGDRQAFGELFDAYARSVYNHAFRLTGDWSMAEDAVSLTFLEAWRLRRRIDPCGGSLRPWLLGIATNTVRNSRRAARRHAAAMARLPRDPEASGGVVGDFAERVVDRIDDAELLRAVRTALETLRPPEREVLALCVWAGLGYAEAAEALDVPLGTVRSRLSRARRRLAAAVEREPRAGRGQLRGDRASAVRPIEESNG